MSSFPKMTRARAKEVLLAVGAKMAKRFDYKQERLTQHEWEKNPRYQFEGSMGWYLNVANMAINYVYVSWGSEGMSIHVDFGHDVAVYVRLRLRDCIPPKWEPSDEDVFMFFRRWADGLPAVELEEELYQMIIEEAANEERD